MGVALNMEQNKKGIVHLLIPIFILIVLVVAVGAFILGGALKQNGNQAPPLPGQPLSNTPGQMPSNQQQGQMPLNPLANHNTYITFSTDGKNWQEGELVKKGASVPDLIQLTKDAGSFKAGDLLIYFVDASTIKNPGDDGISVYSSSDTGQSWSKAGSIKVSGKVNKGGVVDPSIVQLDDGKLRLYYFGSETTSGDPAAVKGPHKVYSATSTDGVNFTAEDGSRFAAEGLTDPEVIQWNGTWFMYYSEGSQTKLATSADGLTFTAQSITGGNVGGVPGALALDNGVRLFGCSQGISEAFSTDGMNFTTEQQDIIHTTQTICDPSAIKLSDGRYAMAYKVEDTSSKSSPGGQMMPPPPGGDSMAPPPQQ